VLVVRMDTLRERYIEFEYKVALVVGIEYRHAFIVY